jgi:hypothetical protein
MEATNAFYNWFYLGLGGLGGWFLFFLLALIAVIWLIYDSASRRLPAMGWRLAVILTAALLLPAILFRFSSAETQITLLDFREIIFYLGLLGGVIPPVVAVGYFVNFRDLVGCPNGHVYDRVLGECPECAPAQPVIVQGQQVDYGRAPAPEPVAPAPPPKPKAQAWLVTDSGRNYQLNLGETTLGRSSRNDIKIDGDTTVGRNHAKIEEQNGHFRLYDLGSTNGTRVNNRLVRQPILLEKDDVIQLGDNTRLRFVK